jgi:malic enzyme
VIKVLVGIALGYVLFTQPQARQVTAELLRAAADALAPAVEDKTPEDRINEVLVGD